MFFLKPNKEINFKLIFSIVLLIAWKFFILWLLTIKNLPSNIPGPLFLDKIVHFVLFLILAFLIFVVFYTAGNGRFESVFTAFIWSSLYSIFCEHVQVLLPYREASFYDFLAGMTGSIFILFFLYIRGYKYPKIKKPRLLLHICCAGCGAYVCKLLRNDYDIVLYYYNPNMYPKDENKKRLDEVQKIAKKNGLEWISGIYDHNKWLQMVQGLEIEPEKGKRCKICFEDRLEETAKFAQKRKFDFFTTTLTISPHKEFEIIKNIGFEMEKKYGVKFLCQDFKKNGGFQKSVKLSKDLDLYRQNY